MEQKGNPGWTGLETDTGGSFVGQTPEDVVDTNAEEAYWRQNYPSRPYFSEGTPFIEYKPAYRYGADSFSKYKGRSFDDVERELADDWDRFKGTSSLKWEQAKHAARDAWQRVSDFIERATPGDSDRDGK